MKLIAIFFISILSLNSTVSAQNGKEKILSPSDTVYRYQGIIPPVVFQYDLNQFFQQPLTKQIPVNIIFTEDRSTIWLRTELLFSNHSYFPVEDEFDAHFTSPLHQQFLKDSEFDMVRYVLGMAQLSAVAYMAYRHIKKYGFLK
jgi:hypothetical protein